MPSVQEHHAPLVYYARRGNLIKIGTTTQVCYRMRKLKADDLLAVEPGSYEVETLRHGQFAAEQVVIERRTHPNEWFRPSDALLAHTEALRALHGLPELPGTQRPDDIGQPERWLPVVGYEGYYEVSDLARVWSVHRPHARGRILHPWEQHGYLAVKLCRDGKRCNAYVHRLVADAFIGPLQPGQVTRHGPGGRHDSRLVNLTQGTPAENGADAVRDGTTRRGARNPFGKLTDEIVADIRRQVAAGAMHREVAQQYGVTQPNISAIVNGKTWRHPEVLALQPVARTGKRGRPFFYEPELIASLYARWAAGETVPVLAAENEIKPQTLGSYFYRLEAQPGHVIDRPNCHVRKYTPELAAALYERHQAGETVRSLAAEIGMEKSSVYIWFRRIAAAQRDAA